MYYYYITVRIKIHAAIICVTRKFRPCGVRAALSIQYGVEPLCFHRLD